MHADRERLAHLLNRLAVPPAEADPAVLAEVHQALKLWARIFARPTSGEEPLDHAHLHALAEALAHLHRVVRLAAGRPLPAPTARLAVRRVGSVCVSRCLTRG